ncbi:hypothetical protein WDU94_014752 [Cyamophila willieti]
MMNKCHREKIHKYRDYLIENTLFDDLWQTLTAEKQLKLIFTDGMIQDILDPSNDCGNECRNERFYDLIVTSPYPEAFNILKNALSSSGQNDLTKLLLEDKLVSTQVDMSRPSNKHPALPPLLEKVKVLRSSSMPLSTWASVKRLYKTYVVQSFPPGYVLLINMKFKMNPLNEERKGSEIDVKNLKSLFTQLNYEIVEYEDLNLVQMEEAIEKFSHMRELAEVDSILVFVMSHGRNPSQRKPNEPPLKSPGRESVDFVLEDNQIINSNDIVDKINQSSTIRPNTPRMFFFNVCRGNRIDWGPNGRGAAYGETDHIADTSTELDAIAFTPSHPHPSSFTPNYPTSSPNDPSQEVSPNEMSPTSEAQFGSNETNNTGSPTNGSPNGYGANGYHGNIFYQYHGSNNHESQHALVSTPSDTNHAQSNGFGTHYDPVQTPPDASNTSRAPLNGSSLNRLVRLKGPAPSLPPLEPTNYSTSCCCIPLSNNKVKRHTCLVRYGVWCARWFKCSMPCIQEEREDAPDRVGMSNKETENEITAGSSYPSNGQNKNETMSSYPGGSQHRTEPIDIPTTPLTQGESVSSTETALVSRSPSKGSANSNRSIVGTFSGVLHKISNKVHLPNKSHHGKILTGDIFMAFSTVDGYNSKRHPSRGSWFIAYICQVFAEKAKDTDLLTMMEEVGRKMSDNCDVQFGTQLHVENKEGFNKKFFFNVELDE